MYSLLQSLNVLFTLFKIVYLVCEILHISLSFCITCNIQNPQFIRNIILFSHMLQYVSMCTVMIL